MLGTHAEAWFAVTHASYYQQASLWGCLRDRSESGIKVLLTDLWVVMRVQVVEAAYSGYRASREHRHGVASTDENDANWIRALHTVSKSFAGCCSDDTSL